MEAANLQVIVSIICFSFTIGLVIGALYGSHLIRKEMKHNSGDKSSNLE